MSAGRAPGRLAMFVAGVAAMAAADAHPLGNASVNRQTEVTVYGERLELVYRLDLAEIPTLIAGQEADRDGDGAVSSSEWETYARGWARTLAPQLLLSLRQRRLALNVRDVDWTLADGAAGLKQLKLTARYRAPLVGAGERAVLDFHDASRPNEAGWREVWVAAGAGARILASNVPAADRSDRLSRFPADATELPNELAARVELAFAGATTAEARRSPPAVAGRVQPEPEPPPAAAADTPTAVTDRQATVATRRSAEPAVTAAARPDPDAFANAWPFFRLGVHHIATGWDHLVFLLGLLLFSQTLAQLVKIVTAFTLAHSVTLALAAAGLVSPPGALIEPAIALTIAYVGLANLFWRARAHGIKIAFAFGLIHGFGFAGALAESLAEHPIGGGHWLLDLAAFNLGIEAFQLALLCVAVPLLRRIERFDWSAAVHSGGAVAVLGAGLSWFVLRVSGI